MNLGKVVVSFSATLDKLTVVYQVGLTPGFIHTRICCTCDGEIISRRFDTRCWQARDEFVKGSDGFWSLTVGDLVLFKRYHRLAKRELIRELKKVIYFLSIPASFKDAVIETYKGDFDKEPCNV